MRNKHIARPPAGGSAPVNTVAPSIVDGQGNALGAAPIAGQPLWVNYGTWAPPATGYSIQWYDDNGILVGESRDSYIPGDNEIGRTIRFSLNGYNASGPALVTVYSAYTAAVVDIVV
jgi:hypothetical protein